MSEKKSATFGGVPFYWVPTFEDPLERLLGRHWAYLLRMSYVIRVFEMPNGEFVAQNSLKGTEKTARSWEKVDEIVRGWLEEEALKRRVDEERDERNRVAQEHAPR